MQNKHLTKQVQVVLQLQKRNCNLKYTINNNERNFYYIVEMKENQSVTNKE